MARIFGLIAAIFMLCVAFVTQSQAGAGRGADYFTNLEVFDQNGRKLKFHDDVLKDKVLVISFIYTSCKDICPLATARLAQVKDMLGERMGRDVHFVSLTVDPETDTPQRLKEFADAFNTGPGWTFITGTAENMRIINRKLGDRSKYPWEHRNEVVLGNDRTDDWMRNSALGDLERLTYDILQMDPAWRKNPQQLAASAEGEAVDVPDHKGEALYRKLCSGCHTVGVGDRVGPDLRGVTARRDAGWLKRFIQNPHKLIDNGDETAVALDEAYPGVRMPILGLSDTDTTDLVAYLEFATKRIQEAPGEQPHNHDHGTKGHDHSAHDHSSN